MIKLWRNARGGRWDRIAKWSIGIGFRTEYVNLDEQFGYNYEVLQSDIRMYSEQYLMCDLEDMDAWDVDVNKVNKAEARRAGLVRQLSVWRRCNPRIMLTNIVGPEGPCSTTSSAAKLLQEHWSKVFAAKLVDTSSWDDFEQHIVKDIAMPNYVYDIEKFSEMMFHTADSAPGPDGVPYSAWCSLGSKGAQLLHDMYLQLMVADPSPPDDAMASLFAFLAKGIDGQDSVEEGAARKPEDTRPLMLGNTDMKFCSKALNGPLADVAAVSVCSSQRGFIKGRYMLDNVIDMEQHRLDMALQGNCKGCLVFLDQKAAFPSVSHLWMFHVLRAMGIPTGILNALGHHYSKVRAQVCIAFKRFGWVLIASGIKQGDPSSGSLWALLFDPVVRRMCLIIPRSFTNAYADDLAIAMLEFVAGMLALLPLLAVVSKATGLEVNFKKTFVVPALPGRLAAFVASFEQFVDGLPHRDQLVLRQLRLVQMAKYLGIFLGEGSHLASLLAPWAKVQQRARTVKLLGQGPLMSIDCYRKYAFSCAGHVLQCHVPSRKLILQERLVMASVLSIPANAVPEPIMLSKHIVGLGMNFPSLEYTTIASQCRVFSHSDRIQESYGHLERLRQSDEIVMGGMVDSFHKELLDQSLIYVIQRSHELIHDLRPALSMQQVGLQRKVIQFLIGHHCTASKAADDIIKRLSRIGIQASLYNTNLFF